MNERLSRLVARWLAHPTGFLQSIIFSVLFIAAAFRVQFHEVVFWYLAACTFVSFATQFTLAYQNNKAERALELALRNMTDMMKLDIALAEKVDEALARLDDGVDKLVAFATKEEQVRDAFLRGDESIAAALANLVEARKQLATPLNVLLPEAPA